MAIGRNDNYVQWTSQQTPSAKGGKGKIQRLDRVSCPDTDIQVLPNLGIAMDQVSCPDTNIQVLTTRFPRASCFKKTHAFCSRNMGVHVQCTCAPSAKGGKGKIQRLDQVSCPDMEIQVLPNLGIAVDWVSCPDTNIGVLTTRFPRASCSKETHAFCSRNMGVHVQCTCVCVCVCLTSSREGLPSDAMPIAGRIHPPHCLRRHTPSRLCTSASPWGDVS